MIPSPRWFLDIAWLKEETARRYDVGSIAACVLIHQSFNRVYRIEAQAGRFVLRVSGGRSQAACESSYELDLLSYLVRRGIPVAAPVATRRGAFVWEIDATLMVQGTTSNVGKRVVPAGLCRLIRRRGARVAPFKALNLSLNAAVTADGGEIARSTAVQAAASGSEPTVDMNPIFLKPEAGDRSQIILQGKVH